MILDKTRTYNVLACCGCGNGTCQILAMKLKNVLKRLDITANVDSAPVSVGTSQWKRYDIIACNQGLVPNFGEAAKSGKIVMGLRNVMSEAEIENKLTELINNNDPS